jgi:hypothetical protein
MEGNSEMHKQGIKKSAKEIFLLELLDKEEGTKNNA